MSASNCEDAATVLVCDMRPASLLVAFTGLRDLLWFRLDIALTNTRWSQGGQQAPRHASDDQRGETTWEREKTQNRQHWHQ